MEYTPLGEFILNQAQNKGITVARLSQATEIPAHHLEALFTGTYSDLPPRPYVRGYLERLIAVLRLDRDQIFGLYAQEADKISGAQDNLPPNRFALPKLKKSTLWIPIVLVLLVAGFFIFGAASGTPYLQIFNPPAQDPYVVGVPEIILRGRIDPNDKLSINGQEVATDTSGNFSLPYTLDPELNSITFTVHRFLGREVTIVRQVYFERTLMPSASLEVSTSTLPEESPL